MIEDELFKYVIKILRTEEGVTQRVVIYCPLFSSFKVSFLIYPDTSQEVFELCLERAMFELKDKLIPQLKTSLSVLYEGHAIVGYLKKGREVVMLRAVRSERREVEPFPKPNWSSAWAKNNRANNE